MLSRKRRAEVIDRMAAAYILQGALDRLRRLAAALAEIFMEDEIAAGHLGTKSHAADGKRRARYWRPQAAQQGNGQERQRDLARRTARRLVLPIEQQHHRAANHDQHET